MIPLRTMLNILLLVFIIIPFFKVLTSLSIALYRITIKHNRKSKIIAY